MGDHKPAASLSESSWPAEKSSWAVSIGLGSFIALAGFTLVLSGMAWFMPRFLRFVDSRWAHLLPAISVCFIAASGILQYLRKRRTSLRRARQAAKFSGPQ